MHSWAATRAAKMKTPEGIEKAEIDKYLKSIGAYVAKPATFGYGASGISDRLCCIKRAPGEAGTFWAIEVKRPDKEPTPLQEKRLQEVRAAGGMTTWGVAGKVIAEIEAWRVF